MNAPRAHKRLQPLKTTAMKSKKKNIYKTNKGAEDNFRAFVRPTKGLLPQLKANKTPYDNVFAHLRNFRCNQSLNC